MNHKSINSKSEIDVLLKKCTYCNVAMIDEDNSPYIVPMNFGYDESFIYLHSAKSGKKIEILKNRSKVCISLSTDHELRWQNESIACSYSMKYRSVLVLGNAEFVENIEEKRHALSIIMKQYSDKKFVFNDPAVENVAVIKVKIERMEGRTYGYEN
jgi:uncharacterized protein